PTPAAARHSHHALLAAARLDSLCGDSRRLHCEPNAWRSWLERIFLLKECTMYTASCVFALQMLGTMASLPTWNVDYGSALKRAEVTNKPLAVFIASGKDGRMAAAAERKLSSEARRLLMNHYVCVYIDASLP